MLIEIMAGLAMGVFGLWQTANFMSENEKQFAVHNTPRPSLPKPPKPKAAEPSTDVLRLVFELLRSDEGWTIENTDENGQHKWTWLHETGVRILDIVVKKSSRRYEIVSILDEKGVYDSVKLSDTDNSLVKKELDAHTTRATDRRQRELARSLAKRIVGGPVPSVLGGADVPRLPPSGDDGEEQHGASTTGLLSYDPSTKRIVASLRGDNVQLELDASLRDRYAINKTGKYSDTLRKYMDDRALDEYNEQWELNR